MNSYPFVPRTNRAVYRKEAEKENEAVEVSTKRSANESTLQGNFTGFYRETRRSRAKVTRNYVQTQLNARNRNTKRK